eukprot:635105-Pyramimonas_sp.AAC.2
MSVSSSALKRRTAPPHHGAVLHPEVGHRGERVGDGADDVGAPVAVVVHRMRQHLRGDANVAQRDGEFKVSASGFKASGVGFKATGGSMVR